MGWQRLSPVVTGRAKKTPVWTLIYLSFSIMSASRLGRNKKGQMRVRWTLFLMQFPPSLPPSLPHSLTHSLTPFFPPSLVPSPPYSLFLLFL